MIRVDNTVPQTSKVLFNCSSVTFHDKFPTKQVVSSTFCFFATGVDSSALRLVALVSTFTSSSSESLESEPLLELEESDAAFSFSASESESELEESELE